MKKPIPKNVPMTEQEKQHQRERLKNLPDSVKESAAIFTTRWVTDQLAEYGFDPVDGPFSEAEMNGDAVWVICTESYKAIFDGLWRWPENRKLSSQMIQVCKSKMAHRVRDYMKRNKDKDNLLTSHTTYTQLMQMEEAAGQWELEANMRELGYEIARSAVGNDSLMLRYLDALYHSNSYDLMAEKLNMTEQEVMRLERKVLKLLDRL